MRFIGLDLGLKKTGIAISDETNTLARGLTTALTQSELLYELDKLSHQYVIEALIVGISKSKFSNQKESITEKIQNLAFSLSENLKLEVIFVDEYLSSWEARERLREMGYKKEEVAKLEDQMAAKIILQSFLDEMNRPQNLDNCIIEQKAECE